MSDGSSSVAEAASDAFIRGALKSKARDVLLEARDTSDALLARAAECIGRWADDQGVAIDNICFVAIGSVGRREALGASDLDLIPIAWSQEALDLYTAHDGALREHLRDELGVKVSKGEELTERCTLESMVDLKTIGGPDDCSKLLTKRILVLTEGRQAGGGFALADVQTAIISAYGDQDRSKGRHVLSLCNDVARYYRLLCVEYKAKAEGEGADWCTRNLKLRHSRKFWYFSCMVPIASLADAHPQGEAEFVRKLRDVFATSPVERLVSISSLRDQRGELEQLLERYAVFLEFMRETSRRKQLEKIEHSDRYSMEGENPFPMLKANSDLLHVQVMRLIDGLSPTSRRRVYDWFLF